MPKLIRGTLAAGGRAAGDDRWVTIGAAAELDTLAAGQAPLVAFSLWPALRDALLGERRYVGVQIGPADDPLVLGPDVESLALIAIEFPRFSDGRGYSLARLVRQRLGYLGELRAVGDVLRDQVFNLLRCGFDSLALRDDQDVAAALAAFSDFREVYQGAGDPPLPLFRRRAQALAALAPAAGQP